MGDGHTPAADHGTVIRQVRERVDSAAANGDVTAVLPLIEDLLRIEDEWLNTCDPPAINNLVRIATALLATGAWQIIEPLLIKAINAFQANPYSTLKDTIIPLNNLMVLYDNTGNREAFNQIATALVNIATQLEEAIDGDIAQVFIQLGSVFQRAGHPDAVQILYRPVTRFMLSDARLSLETRAGWLMTGVRRFQEAGVPEKAIEMLDEAYILISAIPESAAADRITLLGTIGSLGLAGGDMERAESYLSQAVAQLRGAGMEESRTAVGLYHNLATVILKRNDSARYEEAHRLIARSLTISEHLRAETSAAYAGGLAQLANIEVLLDRPDEAVLRFQQAFSIYDQAEDTNTDEFADFLADAGFLHLALKDFTAAKQAFQKALRLREMQPEGDSEHMATALSNLALVCFRMEDWAGAAELYTRAADLRHQAMVG